jgi:hypothetical protein
MNENGDFVVRHRSLATLTPFKPCLSVMYHASYTHLTTMYLRLSGIGLLQVSNSNI